MLAFAPSLSVLFVPYAADKTTLSTFAMATLYLFGVHLAKSVVFADISKVSSSS